MTLPQEHSSPVVSWTEPEGLNPRGTVVVIPVRGEQPHVYERFGRRLAADAYRVHSVANPVEDRVRTEEQIGHLLAGPGPFVLAGRTRARYSRPGWSRQVDRGRRAGADGTADGGRTGRERADLGHAAGATPPGATQADEARAAGAPAGEPGGNSDAGAAFAAELEARTACPHRGRLAGPVLRRGALYGPAPDGRVDAAGLKSVSVPVLPCTAPALSARSAP